MTLMKEIQVSNFESHLDGPGSSSYHTSPTPHRGVAAHSFRYAHS
jgi:hypothetical protein